MSINNRDKFLQYRQSLGAEVNNIEQEARMVLPGIQTLFGFQLMVAFTSDFKVTVTQYEQYIHLMALLLVAVSGVLVVAPAAYHRQANHQISKHFVELSSRFLTWALAPLAIGTSLDIYIVSRIMSDSFLVAMIVSITIFTLYVSVWFVYPRIRGRKLTKLSIHDLSGHE